MHSNILQPLQCLHHDLRSPRLVVRISKRHRNINHQPAICRRRFLPQLFDQQARIISRHVGIRAPEIRRNRIRIPNRSHARSSECPVETFFVDHNPNNFPRVGAGGKGSVQLRHYLFAVRHLLDVLRRNKTHRIDVLESCKHKFLEVLRFVFRRDEIRQSLPGIAWTLDDFNCRGHLDLFLLIQRSKSRARMQSPKKVKTEAKVPAALTDCG